MIVTSAGKEGDMLKEKDGGVQDAADRFFFAMVVDKISCAMGKEREEIQF